MQKENVSYAEFTTASADKSPTATATNSSSPPYYSRNNSFLSPTSPSYANSTTSSIYSSLFENYSPVNYSVNSPSEFVYLDGVDSDRRQSHESSSILEYQQLYNRYTLCLAHLHDAIDEADALRRENESLRLSNADLAHRIALFLSRDRLISEFNRLSVVPSPSTGPVVNCVGHANAGVQPLAERNHLDRRSANERAVTIPKSISVRSSGYLKMNRPAGRELTRRAAVSQPIPASQRVCVPTSGPEKENAALELDVYNQGMFKTELCNKWQETGACPYGDNCQFAHGIKELRPVIRHPRYKTEVCRMVLSGGMCPYGHRCHFRHSLTEQERLMMGPSAPTC